MASISKLKTLIAEEEAKERIDANRPYFGIIYEAEYKFLKEHKSMNINAYQKEYAEILKNRFGITTPYNKLSDAEKEIVIKELERFFDLKTEEFKLRNTVMDFKCPPAQLWLHITKK